MLAPPDRATVPHDTWGAGCDGWRLCDTPAMSVIEEGMPVGIAETAPRHALARQVFQVSAGGLTMAPGRGLVALPPRQAVTVPPGTVRPAANKGPGDAVVPVISAPSTRGDRIEEAAA